jgi:hypothetical protein
MMNFKCHKIYSGKNIVRLEKKIIKITPHSPALTELSMYGDSIVSLILK